MGRVLLGLVLVIALVGFGYGSEPPKFDLLSKFKPPEVSSIVITKFDSRRTGFILIKDGRGFDMENSVKNNRVILSSDTRDPLWRFGFNIGFTYQGTEYCFYFSNNPMQLTTDLTKCSTLHIEDYSDANEKPEKDPMLIDYSDPKYVDSVEEEYKKEASGNIFPQNLKFVYMAKAYGIPWLLRYTLTNFDDGESVYLYEFEKQSDLVVEANLDGYTEFVNRLNKYEINFKNKPWGKMVYELYNYKTISKRYATVEQLFQFENPDLTQFSEAEVAELKKFIGMMHNMGMLAADMVTQGEVMAYHYPKSSITKAKKFTYNERDRIWEFEDPSKELKFDSSSNKRPYLPEEEAGPSNPKNPKVKRSTDNLNRFYGGIYDDLKTEDNTSMVEVFALGKPDMKTVFNHFLSYTYSPSKEPIVEFNIDGEIPDQMIMDKYCPEKDQDIKWILYRNATNILNYTCKPDQHCSYLEIMKNISHTNLLSMTGWLIKNLSICNLNKQEEHKTAKMINEFDPDKQAEDNIAKNFKLNSAGTIGLLAIGAILGSLFLLAILKKISHRKSVRIYSQVEEKTISSIEVNLI